MRKRKIPQRTCIGCRTVRPKKELIRIVRTPEGEIVFDPTGKKNGRGAYICPNTDCLESATKAERLAKALEHSLDEAMIENLRETLKALQAFQSTPGVNG